MSEVFASVVIHVLAEISMAPFEHDTPPADPQSKHSEDPGFRLKRPVRRSVMKRVAIKPAHQLDTVRIATARSHSHSNPQRCNSKPSKQRMSK